MRRSEDGQLLMKKQEQWAKEREESNDGWFLNSSPGGGNPNKKHLARDYDISKTDRTHTGTAENVPPQDPTSRGGRSASVETDPRSLHMSKRSASCDEAKDTNGAPSYAPPPPPSVYGNGAPAPMMPFMYGVPLEYMQQYHPHMQQYGAMPYPSAGGGVPPSASGVLQYPNGASGAPHYGLPIPVQMLPPGTVPIPIPPPTMMTSSYTERWASQVPEWSSRIEEVQEDGASSVIGAPPHPTTTAVSIMPQGGATVIPIGRGEIPHAYVTPMVAAAATTTVLYQPAGGGGGQPMERGGGYAESSSDAKCGGDTDYAEKERTEDVYKAQIEEHRRLEAAEAERARREDERIRREREEREETKRREEQRKEEEARKREEDREKSTNAVLEAIEKAKKEAEMLKKMRLHRHAMEADVERSKEMMGVSDERKIDEMKREVDALQRQRRLDQEEIARNAPPKDKKDSGRQRAGSVPRSPSMCIDHSYVANPPPVAAASSPSPFRRTASLAPNRRVQSPAGAASGARTEPRSVRTPPAAQSPAARTQSPVASQRPTATATVSPFVRDANSRYSLRAAPSPSTTTSSRSIIDDRPISSSSSINSREMTPMRPPMAPKPRALQQQHVANQGMPSRNSPLSRTFHAGDRTRRSLREPVRSSGYGIGGSWLFSPPSSSCGRRTPNDEDMRGRRDEDRDRDTSTTGGSGESSRTNETFTTSPTVMSRMDMPDMAELRRASPYDTSATVTPTPTATRPLREQNRPRFDDDGRKSQIPVPLPRTVHGMATSATNPLFSCIPTRSRKMRISKDVPAYSRDDSMDSSVASNDSSGSGSEATSELRRITAPARVVPVIQVDSSAEETDQAPVKMFTPRFSSRPCTPNGAPTRHYSDRVREMGTAMPPNRITETLSPTVQPRQSSFEPSSSLSASLRNLRMSMNNLNMACANNNNTKTDPGVGGAGAGTPDFDHSVAAFPDSPSLARFHSRTTQYRSFNTKRGTERQQQLLDRLVSLRSRLQETQSYKDRPLSRQGSILSNGSRLKLDASSP